MDLGSLIARVQGTDSHGRHCQRGGCVIGGGRSMAYGKSFEVPFLHSIYFRRSQGE